MGSAVAATPDLGPVGRLGPEDRDPGVVEVPRSRWPADRVAGGAEPAPTGACWRRPVALAATTRGRRRAPARGRGAPPSGCSRGRRSRGPGPRRCHLDGVPGVRSPGRRRLHRACGPGTARSRRGAGARRGRLRPPRSGPARRPGRDSRRPARGSLRWGMYCWRAPAGAGWPTHQPRRCSPRTKGTPARQPAVRPPRRRHGCWLTSRGYGTRTGRSGATRFACGPARSDRTGPGRHPSRRAAGGSRPMRSAGSRARSRLSSESLTGTGFPATTTGGGIRLARRSGGRPSAHTRPARTVR